jgi:regulator of protease activity HflC (stomatin/prohibitin superfamily)
MMSVSLPEGQVELEGAWAQSAKLSFRFLLAVVCLAAIGWVFSNFRQVPPDSRAVVFRFGSIARQQGAGLLPAWPRPIERVVLVPSADRQIEFKIDRFDAETNPGGVGPMIEISSPAGAKPRPDPLVATIAALAPLWISNNPRNNAGFLLTGDAAVVHLQASLFYQVSDPAAYVLAAEHVGPALERLFIASAVSVCAGRDLDTILVARPEMSAASDESSRRGREQLRSDLRNAVNRRLEDLANQGAGLGIAVSRVDIAASVPSGAKSAFDFVLIAMQEGERGVALARTAAATTVQRASQTRDRILTQAEAMAAEQVTQAKTRTAAITTLATQSPGLSGRALLDRIYYDRIGALLAKAKSVDAIDSKGSAHLILPAPPK